MRIFYGYYLPKLRRARSRGFTFIELLTVIAIISIMSVLAFAAFNSVKKAGDVLVDFKLRFLGRGGERESPAIGLQTLEQRAHHRERFHLGQVVAPEKFAAEFLDRLAPRVKIFRRNEIVAAFPD